MHDDDELLVIDPDTQLESPLDRMKPVDEAEENQGFAQS